MFFATIYLIMNIYQSRHSLLPGSSLGELSKLARHEYHIIQKRTPRRVPYVRSTYFTKDKIFVNSFWDHTNKKSPQERVRRLKLYKCALDTLRNTPSLQIQSIRIAIVTVVLISFMASPEMVSSFAFVSRKINAPAAKISRQYIP